MNTQYGPPENKDEPKRNLLLCTKANLLRPKVDVRFDLELDEDGCIIDDEIKFNCFLFF